MSSVAGALERFTAQNPCPLCGGHPGLPQHQGIRCIGGLSANGELAFCSRVPSSKEGPLGTHFHNMQGECHFCGERHDNSPRPAPKYAGDGEWNGRNARSRPAKRATALDASVAVADAMALLDGTPARRQRPYPWNLEAQRVWPAHDLRGRHVADNFRFVDPATGEKTLRWGVWRAGGQPPRGGLPKGVGLKNLQFFGWERLAEFPDAAVVIVEGAKSGEAAQRWFSELGMIGLATMTGAATIPSKEVLATLADRVVYTVEDIDEPDPKRPLVPPDGEKHMRMLQAGLVAAGAACVNRIVLPNPTKDGYDIADYEGSVDELLDLVISAPDWKSVPSWRPPGFAPEPAPVVGESPVDMLKTERRKLYARNGAVRDDFVAMARASGDEARADAWDHCQTRHTPWECQDAWCKRVHLTPRSCHDAACPTCSTGAVIRDFLKSAADRLPAVGLYAYLWSPEARITIADTWLGPKDKTPGQILVARFHDTRKRIPGIARAVYHVLLDYEKGARMLFFTDEPMLDDTWGAGDITLEGMGLTQIDAALHLAGRMADERFVIRDQLKAMPTSHQGAYMALYLGAIRGRAGFRGFGKKVVDPASPELSTTLEDNSGDQAEIESTDEPVHGPKYGDWNIAGGAGAREKGETMPCPVSGGPMVPSARIVPRDLVEKDEFGFYLKGHPGATKPTESAE